MRWNLGEFNALEIHNPWEQVHIHLVLKLQFTYAKMRIQENNSLSWWDQVSKPLGFRFTLLSP